MDWLLILACCGLALAIGYVVGRRATPDIRLFGETIAGPHDFTADEREQARAYINGKRADIAASQQRQAQARNLRVAQPDDGEDVPAVTKCRGNRCLCEE